jgi:hypothetical protein
MEIFEFIAAVCFLALFTGFIAKLIILLPASILMGIFENGKILFYGKIVKAFIVSSIIVFYILSFTKDKSLFISILYYILGFYSYWVMYTLENETDKDAIQDEQKYPLDTIMLKATSYDKFLIVFSLIFFVLFLTFPILTKYIIPSVCYNLYNWLMGYKVIYWISIVLGGIFTIYIIRFTFFIGRLAKVIKRI